MVHFTVCVVMVVVSIYSNTATAESCTNFTTHTTVTGENATLEFSLPDACMREHDISLVTVSVEKSTGEATDICLFMSTSWSKKSAAQCALDQQSQEYSVTRQLGTTASRRESVILTAKFVDRERIVTRVLLELPDISTVPSVTTASATIADEPQTTLERRQPSENRGTTAELTSVTESSTNGAGPSDTGTSDKDESSENKESNGPKDDNHSFTQTPAFAGFLIVGVVMTIMMILLVVLLRRLRALARRRTRNSLVIPDCEHHYERPIHRRGIQQQPLPLPPPPPPSNPLVNRDSLPDPNYAVIDDVSSGDYEIPVPAIPSVPASTQAETSV